MAPPQKKFMVGNKTILQSYLDNLTAPEEGTEPPEEDNSGMTYFVDEEGRYYYQSTGDNQNLVSVPSDTEVEVPLVDPIMVDNERSFQTVTLVPSENNQGEVSYVLVVQEENKPVINIDIKNEQGSDDVYEFEEDEEAAEESAGDDKPEPKAKSKSASRRPLFTCSFCPYTSHRRYLLLRHMKSHSEERPHMCAVCERGFKTQASLNNHVNMHNGVKPHVCKYCKSTFTTSGELIRHVRYKHTYEKPHRCTECDYASVELSKLRRHVRCHTGERPYQCPHCTYASPDTFKLKRHLRTHTGEKPYKCDHCNMCFTQSNSLKSHKLIHNVADKPVYACELCPAKCSRKTDLRIHIQKLHTSDVPLKCKRCGKSFPDRYSCKMHNKTHEGEKCYKCKLCPYASTTLRHLKSHMLKHTDEKPFACPECDQSFRQKQLLRRHVNLYHNPQYVPKPPKEKTHSCRECNRQFARKGNLIRHLAIHDPDSGHKEHALALKIGRQKRVKIVDGQMKVVRDMETDEPQDIIKVGMSSNELKRGELVTVADGDGQQYVVLEVIQLEDGTEQQVAVVAPEFSDEENEENEEEEQQEEEEEPVTKPMVTKDIVRQRELEKNIKLEHEVDRCFGFDEEEEPEEQEGNTNAQEEYITT